MKRLLVHWLANKLSKLGQTNPKYYRVLMGFIIILNAILLDPQVTELVNSEFGDNKWVTRIFHFVSMFVMAVMGPNTKKTPADSLPPEQANAKDPDTRKRKKFVFF